MDFLPDVVFLVGRVLFALIFINSGIAHLTKLNAMTGYAQFKKVPAPKLAVIVTGLMLIIGGVGVEPGIGVGDGIVTGKQTLRRDRGASP